MTDWSQLVEQHGPIVWKTVYRLVGNDADAADCFQDAFVSAWELQQKEPVHNWLGLLKRLATTRALERLRQRYRESSRHAALPDNELADSAATDPSAEAESGELAEQLRDAIAQLDSLQAEVVCLAYLKSLSYQEIAETMGITVNHVGVLLNRARSNLKERLANWKPASNSLRFKRDSQS